MATTVTAIANIGPVESKEYLIGYAKNLSKQLIEQARLAAGLTQQAMASEIRNFFAVWANELGRLTKRKIKGFLNLKNLQRVCVRPGSSRQPSDL